MLEHDAIEIAKLTPANGWGVEHVTKWTADNEPYTVEVPRPDPETVTLSASKAELEARIRRAYRRLVEYGLPPRQLVGDRPETDQEWFDRLRVTNCAARLPGETHQQWADHLSGQALHLLHTIRVAYLNLEAL